MHRTAHARATRVAEPDFLLLTSGLEALECRETTSDASTFDKQETLKPLLRRDPAPIPTRFPRDANNRSATRAICAGHGDKRRRPLP